MQDNKDLKQAITELIRLHDDVLARTIALQTLLQDLDLVFPEEVQHRTNEVRKRFALDLEARLAKLGKEMDPAKEIQRRQRIFDEYEGRQQ
jgi:hypothetical protein